MRTAMQDEISENMGRSMLGNEEYDRQYPYGSDVPDPTPEELEGAAEEHYVVQEDDAWNRFHRESHPTPYLNSAPLLVKDRIETLLRHLATGYNPTEAYAALCEEVRGE